MTDADENYGLNWHGKRRARQIALTPSTGTLRPARRSVDWETTQNLMIEAITSSAEAAAEELRRQGQADLHRPAVQHRQKDFVYPDSFQDSIRNYLELTGRAEGGAKSTAIQRPVGGFTNWLNMM